jgi:L-asparaginase
LEVTVLNNGKKNSKVKTRVLLIYTGGTIGMAPRDPDNPASPLVPKPLEELRRYAPQLNLMEQRKALTISYTVAFDPPLDSSDITPTHWVGMARIIRDNYDYFEGFVILHGTDTMAYTSSALAFILNNLSKPVVITGSQLPISHERSDAVQNLVNSVQLAGYKAFGLPRIPEVALCFGNKILRGCRATKISNDDFASFDSPNFPSLGTIGERIKINQNLVWSGPDETEDFYINEEQASEIVQKANILDIGLWPGFKASQLEAMINLPNVRGVVLRTFGAGNTPSDPDFLKVIESAVNRENPCVILNVTQCFKGMVKMGQYTSSSELLERGVVSGLDMTKEAALAKLYWTLATQLESVITSQLQINQRGEQSQNLYDLRYGSGGSAGAPVSEPFRAVHSPDSRLNRKNLYRAVVRLSGLGFAGVENGDTVRVRLFMNKPAANASTPGDDPCCVAECACVWEGKPITMVQEITEKTRAVIGRGDIILSVVPLAGVKMWFKGLYLALFDRAEF